MSHTGRRRRDWSQSSLTLRTGRNVQACIYCKHLKELFINRYICDIGYASITCDFLTEKLNVAEHIDNFPDHPEVDLSQLITMETVEAGPATKGVPSLTVCCHNLILRYEKVTLVDLL